MQTTSTYTKLPALTNAVRRDERGQLERVGCNVARGRFGSSRRIACPVDVEQVAGS